MRMTVAYVGQNFPKTIRPCYMKNETFGKHLQKGFSALFYM